MERSVKKKKEEKSVSSMFEQERHKKGKKIFTKEFSLPFSAAHTKKQQVEFKLRKIIAFIIKILIVNATTNSDTAELHYKSTEP